MPARANGIGTTYIGKRDMQVQQGVCESCHRSGPLSNYETRLWFTVFFIPIIPLTRKQILNYCSRCTRHRAMGVDEWKQVQADAIGSAIASVDANPDSPEHAVECHATMAACGKREEAAQYADAMTSRFANNAEVLMYLGGWFERIGQSARADQCFDQALAADPQHPGALRAAAIGLAQKNKPREAEAKLATLQPPSQHYDPAMFFAVGQAYQNVGDHESAARMFKVVADTTPSAAKEEAFRKAVQKSEAALGKHGSVLAPIPWFKRRAFWWSALAAGVLAAIAGFDRYFARNRELFVVNGLPAPLTVRIDGGVPVQVSPTGQLKLTASEGPHTISVVEPAVLARGQEFTIDASIGGRWWGKQVNVVDPTRSAIMVWEEAVYSKNPNDQEGDAKLHVAEPLVKLDNIDYKFVEFPHDLRVKGHTKKVTKRRIGLLELSPAQLLLTSPDCIAGNARLDFLESHLATDADRVSLLRYYWHAAADQNQLPRLRDYLKKSLDARPLDIELHRTYQTAAEQSGEAASLAPIYDALLVKEPDNADLLYLRGRIEPYAADSARYWDPALKVNPEHSFILSGRAHQLFGAGQFEEGLAAIEKAIAADKDRGELADGRNSALQAIGRRDQIVKELQDKLNSGEEGAWSHYSDLIATLAVQGKYDEAEKALGKFSEIIDREWPQDPLQLKLKSRVSIRLMAKEYDQLRAEVAQITDPMIRTAWSFTANLCDDRPEAAASDLDGASIDSRAFNTLALSIAWRNKQNAAAAQESLKRAIEYLSAGSSEQQIVAQWLEQPPADLAELVPKITDLTIEPEDKVVVLLALAEPGRNGREQLIALAEKLSVWPTGRKAFIETTLAGMK